MSVNLKAFDQIKIYISYSHAPRDRILVFELADYLKTRLSKVIGKILAEDDPLFSDPLFHVVMRDSLKKSPKEMVGQLFGLGQRAVDITCDRKVASDTWWHEFDRGSVERANFILLMVSPDYLASDHCRTLMNRVHSREQEGLVEVIPIVLRQVDWKPPPSWISLPRNGQPVIDWPDREEAFAHITDGILQVIPADVQKVWVERVAWPEIGASEGDDERSAANYEVHLGLTVPGSISRGSEFVARFAAYTPRFRKLVSQNLRLEGPTAKQILGLQKCQWRPGTLVSIMLHSNKCRVAEPQKTFLWNGEWEIQRFDLEVLPDAAEGTAILKMDVYIEGFVVASLRPEITITSPAASVSKQLRDFELKVPRSAFASYSSQDREEVMGRIRSLQIVADINVFIDCLSVRPGEEWKTKLHSEIRNREIFWLFWSREAMASEFVEWEWHTAYALKGKKFIQPHPLEPIDLAPPPKELEDLQFGSAFEAYAYSLRSKRT
jgi:hypothetical protein